MYVPDVYVAKGLRKYEFSTLGVIGVGECGPSTSYLQKIGKIKYVISEIWALIGTPNFGDFSKIIRNKSV